jgi:glycosyltransferase involved in cell wall biosynthesis
MFYYKWEFTIIIQMAKKQILILISHYLPGFKSGGPISSISNLIDVLGSEYDFSVLTTDRDLGESKPYLNLIPNTWIDRGTYKICYIKKDYFLVFRIIKQINKVKKDIVYLNSFFDPYFSIAIIVTRRFGILKAENLVIAPRGELFDEALDFKSKKKSVYLWWALKFGFYKNVRWHASTLQEKESIIKVLGVKGENIIIAVNLPKSSQSEDDNEICNFSVPGDQNNERTLRLVFLSRISKDKNIAYTFDVLSKVKCNVVFDIFGPIEDNNIWDICKEKIEKLPSNVRVTYLGNADRNQVRKILKSYDLFFLPTFAENYGHAIAESLSVGTPVLISDKTPWRNLEEDKLGWDISLDSLDSYVHAIQDCFSWSNKQRSEIRAGIINYFKKRISNPEILDATRDLFKQ